MDTVNLDQAVEQLNKHKNEWAGLAIRRKIDLLKQMRNNTMSVAESWVLASCKAKGIPQVSSLVGEEWGSGPYSVIFAINRLIETMEALAKGHPREFNRKSIRVRDDGQVAVEVFPLNVWDRIFFSGIHAEVWMQPGISPRDLQQHMSSFYKQANPEGKVALVLGAGNINSIPVLDTLHKLYNEGQVVYLKVNPVNEYLIPCFERVFAPMIDAGYVAITRGGADVGSYLTTHDGIDEVHMTGSAKTHDAIVFGTGDSGERNKAQNKPILQKRITSELGGVGPTIVVPGPWTEEDLHFQSERIVTQKYHNGGYNCLGLQVLITPATWKQTEHFLDVLEETIRSSPPRKQFYPGTETKYQQFADLYADKAEMLDSEHEPLPRLLIKNVDPESKDEVCFQEEMFGNIMVQTNIPGYTALDFLKNAVDFANNKLMGTLGANIIIHPATLKELGTEFDEVLAELRYGVIGVNIWSGVSFAIAQATWGAYPGHSATDIQSGVGVVHNAMMFDKPEKSVIYGNFTPLPRNLRRGEWHIQPKPAWFVTGKHGTEIVTRITKFEAKHNVLSVPGIIWYALRN